jgi:hypothetical protein
MSGETDYVIVGGESAQSGFTDAECDRIGIKSKVVEVNRPKKAGALPCAKAGLYSGGFSQGFSKIKTLSFLRYFWELPEDSSGRADLGAVNECCIDGFGTLGLVVVIFYFNADVRSVV